MPCLFPVLATAAAKDVREGDALCVTPSSQGSFCDGVDRIVTVLSPLGVFIRRIRVGAGASNTGDVGGDGKAEHGISGGLITGASNVECSVAVVGWGGEDMTVRLQGNGWKNFRVLETNRCSLAQTAQQGKSHTN